MTDDELDQACREAFKIAEELRAASNYLDKPHYPIRPLGPLDLANWSERVYRIAMTLAALKGPDRP